jgi:predicted Zn finger-like uncharacterized protein
MRLVCLECSAAYEAPDSLFGPQPREVRCNRCGYQWTVIGSSPGETAAPSALSIGPAEQTLPALAAGLPPPPQPAPAVPAAPVPEAAAMPPPPQATPQPASEPARAAARLADSLAGPLPPPASLPPPPIANELASPAIVVEPQAASTRSLLANGAATAPVMDGPDPEERRLSHELDFGDTDRGRPTREGTGGARRAALLLIVLLVVVIIAAVMFKPQIIVAVPATKAAYTAVGL